MNMEAMEAINMILKVASPLIMIVMVVYLSGESIDLVKKAVGVK